MIISRCPSFQYPCTCKQACSNGNVLCLMNKTTRNSCKRCRFVKCEISAGMKRQWVLQQYIPKVLNLGDPFYKLCNFKTKLNKDSKDASESMKKKTINKQCENKCTQTESSSSASELTKKSAKNKVYCLIAKYIINILVTFLNVAKVYQLFNGMTFVHFRMLKETFISPSNAFSIISDLRMMLGQSRNQTTDSIM